MGVEAVALAEVVGVGVEAVVLAEVEGVYYLAESAIPPLAIVSFHALESTYAVAPAAHSETFDMSV